MSEQQVIRIEDPASPDAAIILDNRYFPVLVQCWIGVPTMEMAKKYFEFRRPTLLRDRKEGTKVVILSELSQSGTPPATVRKYIGDTGKIEDPEWDELLGYVVCVPSAIIRGVVTALKWLTGDTGKPSVMAGSLDEGLEKARKMLEMNGVNLPPFKYTPPS